MSGTVNVPFVMDTSANQPPPPAVVGNILNPGLTAAPAEFVGDAYSGFVVDATRPGWATQRIASNLHQRYRIIGNPFLRSVGLRMENFSMNPVVPTWWERAGTGGSWYVQSSIADYAAMGWYYGAAPALTGQYAYPVTLAAPVESNNSLMFPGVLFHVVTGRDAMGSTDISPTEGESWGFETSRIEVTGGSYVTVRPAPS